MSTVLLFRDPDENYGLAFASKNFQPIFIPPLSEVIQLNELISLLNTDPDDLYWGIVSTSKRASLAFKQAFQRSEESLVSGIPGYLCKWKRLTFFAVGKATALPFIELDCQVEGVTESFNAASLSNYIVDFVNNVPLEQKVELINKKLIFLVGDKTRSDINDTLTKNGIPLTTLQVYQTFPHPHIQASILETQNKINGVTWCVFFSPSGVDAALPLLKKLPFFQSSRIAAIGKTTQAHLLHQSFTVHTVPETPTLESLVTSLLSTN